MISSTPRTLPETAAKTIFVMHKPFIAASCVSVNQTPRQILNVTVIPYYRMPQHNIDRSKVHEVKVGFLDRRVNLRRIRRSRHCRVEQLICRYRRQRIRLTSERAEREYTPSRRKLTPLNSESLSAPPSKIS